jgi:hypothetical protein
LSSQEATFLQGVPKENPNYTRAWGAVLRDAEMKKDYKGHCAASGKIMELSANKYHPEWNLEQAKCQMRNNDFNGAIRSAENTIGNAMDMSAGTKTQRLLLAHEIKARSRTRILDDAAKANSGIVDEGKLNQAIQAWTEYSNYASGVGNQAGIQKAEKELADLTARKGG